MRDAAWPSQEPLTTDSLPKVIVTIVEFQHPAARSSQRQVGEQVANGEGVSGLVQKIVGEVEEVCIPALEELGQLGMFVVEGWRVHGAVSLM